MQKIYTVAVGDLEARVFVNPVPAGTHVHGIAFDENAARISSIPSTLYVGFCHWELVYKAAGELLASRRGIEYEDVAAAVSKILPECECE